MNRAWAAEYSFRAADIAIRRRVDGKWMFSKNRYRSIGDLPDREGLTTEELEERLFVYTRLHQRAPRVYIQPGLAMLSSIATKEEVAEHRDAALTLYNSLDVEGHFVRSTVFTQWLESTLGASEIESFWALWAEKFHPQIAALVALRALGGDAAVQRAANEIFKGAQR